MLRLIALSALLSALLLSAVGQPAAAQMFPGDATLVRDRTIDQRPALMVLGAPHLANHNRDVQRTDIADVLTPSGQAEVEAVVARLAAWRPTRIAVEIEAGDQAELDKRYADFRAGRYALSASEVDQFGLRLAALLGHDRVHAVDWNDMPPGAMDDYDWSVGAAQRGEEARMAALRSPEWGQRLTALAASRPMAEWLTVMNGTEFMTQSHRRYYDYALLGDQGANWVGAWHGRNLKIFANLVRVAHAPGERVLVIYGVGHAFLLNRFASESGAFNVQDSSEWLRAAH